jgi:DNA-binding NarL/FixJ family response regulator
VINWTCPNCAHSESLGAQLAALFTAAGRPVRVESALDAVPLPAPRGYQAGPLTVREREIVMCVAEGLANKEIATRLFIAPQTVKNHKHNIFEKLGVTDALELALYAIHHKLVAWPEVPAAIRQVKS